MLVQYYHNEGIKDFYTGEPIDYQDIKIAHIIPYNYIYSNDLWNLVITHKSTKLRVIPTEADMKKLKTRNKNLLKEMSHLVSKEKQDLENVINNNLLDQCFLDMRGKKNEKI